MALGKPKFQQTLNLNVKNTSARMTDAIEYNRCFLLPSLQVMDDASKINWILFNDGYGRFLFNQYSAVMAS